MNEILTLEYSRRIRLMGSDFEFVVVDDQDAGERLLDEAVEEVRRIETLLTEFSETSETSYINAAAGIEPVHVSDEVYAMLKRCKDISALTQGAFDITAGVLKKLYRFNGTSAVIPDPARLKTIQAQVGFDKILLLNDNRVLLKESGMHIGFGAIGKGYAADRVKQKLIQRGIKSAVINASGDLTAFGHRADGSLWKVGIADPNDTSRIMAWIPVRQASVATSGNYEQYFMQDGVRYGHTLDPKTGRPVTGIKSVTIVSPSAELSDALATAVTIMGVSVGLHFVDQLPGIHALIITDENKVHTSKHLHPEYA